jgi:hypothetical protein
MAKNVTQSELTKAEIRLIDTLIDPNNRLKTVQQICDISRCKPRTYYRAFEKEYFIQELQRRSRQIAVRHVGQTMAAFVREAQRGSYQHGKVILEMSGVYTERKEVTGKNGGPIQVDDVGLTDEERAQRIATILDAARARRDRSTSK